MAKVELTTTAKPTKEKPAAPAAAAAAAAEKIPTAEELAARQKDIIASMGWENAISPQAQKELKPAAAATVDGDPEPPKPAPAAPAAPVPKPAAAPAAAPRPATVSTEIEQAAQRAAQLVADQRPAAPAAPAVPATPKAEAPKDMSPADTKDLQCVQALERSDPTKYAGRAEKFLAYLRDYYAYQDEWEARPENEGKDFDSNDDDHDDWYAKHDAGTTDAEIETGREKLIEERIYENRIKPEQDKAAKKELEEKKKADFEKALPTIRSNIQNHTLKLIEQVNPTLAAVFTDKDGRPVFNEETKTSATEADPIATEELETFIRGELHPKLMAMEVMAVDPDFVLNRANIVHAEIGATIEKAETAMLNAPPEVRIQDGKEFATIAQMERMKQSIINSNAPDKERQVEAIDQRYYTLTIDDIEQEIVADVAERAAKRIEALDNRAKRKYGPANGDRQQETSYTPPSGGKPRPPSAGSGVDTARTSDQPTPGQKKFGETMAEVMFKK